MKGKYRTGTIGALLDEYQIAVNDLKSNIIGISDNDLLKIIDTETSNNDCISVQSILTHVILCGYNYITMIDIHRGNADSVWPVRKKHNTVAEYNIALDEMLDHANKFFDKVSESEMAQFNSSKKILTFWGQLYDIEQLMEHAIVHVSRHRRQIQKFKKAF